MQVLRTKSEEDPQYYVRVRRAEKKVFWQGIFFLDSSFPACCHEHAVRDECVYVCTKSTWSIIVFHSMKAKKTSECMHSGQVQQDFNMLTQL